jgi:predicted ATPase
VLANFEHLMDASSAVSELVSTCPRLILIVTSRARLRLRGEHVVQVEPLETPNLATDDGRASFEELSNVPAVRLFLERAHDAAATLAVTAENAPAVCAICQRLDGLPLAIELAAARTQLLSPAALLSRLEHRLGILTEGARDAPDRQQTLRGTIGWSYDLLTAAEQAFFLKVSIFVDGFTLDAAEAVAVEPGEDALAIVTSLLEKNLLRRDVTGEGDIRFAMLETIREYGLEMLAAAGEE